MRVIFLFVALFMHTVLRAQTSAQPASFNMDLMILTWKARLLNQSFPSFKAKAKEGNVSNEIFKNKVVLINFWFETCHGCMAEMDDLNDLYEKLKGHKDFLFVSFTFDDDAAIKRVVEKYKVKFNVLQTSNRECGRLMMLQSGYPTTMILDKTGAIKYLHGGSYDISFEKTPSEIISSVMPAEIQSLLQQQ